jgi:hypothetical protein
MRDKQDQAHATASHIFIFSAVLMALSTTPVVRGQEVKRGTAIAAFRTSKEIVVAADSKSVDLNYKAYPEKVCKIRRAGNGIFFAPNGLVEDKDTGFELFTIVENAAKNSSRFDQKLTSIKAAVSKPFLQAALHLRNSSPDLYAGLAIFGIERGVPRLSVLRFSLHNGLTSVDQHDCPGPQRMAVQSYLVGSTEDKALFQPRIPANAGADLVDLARGFVQLNIDNNSKDTGPPIDIIRLDRSGPHWIQRKKECDGSGPGPEKSPPRSALRKSS